jgi:extradiol dioxygenase family protein
MNPVLFHLAIPITDIAKAKAFYIQGLGCELGRESRQALILNFCGHQVVTHLTPDLPPPQKGIYPRHFGVIFSTLEDWQGILTRAKSQRLDFYEAEKLRFPQLLTEHRTFFLADPFHNLIEFKFYSHPEAIFGGRELAEVGDR